MIRSVFPKKALSTGLISPLSVGAFSAVNTSNSFSQLPSEAFVQKRFKTSSARRLRQLKKDTDEHPFVQNLIKNQVPNDLDKRIFPSGKGDGVSVIDCYYRNLPSTAAAFLLKEGNEAAYVDNNTVHSVPALLHALKVNDLKPENVKYIILTHAHLDHAGATFPLSQLCPNAKVLCHPKAARHLNDPSRLVGGVRRVFGYQLIEELFKAEEIKSIPLDRIQPIPHGTKLHFGKREIEFTHVLGHARHHILIHDLTNKAIFTGDALGVSYQPFVNLFVRKPNAPKDSFLFPTTAPTDFDANEEWRVLDRVEQGVKDGKINYAYLTHFGLWNDMPKGLRQLRMAYLLHSNLTLQIRHRIQSTIFNHVEAQSFGQTSRQVLVNKQYVSRRDGSALPIDEYYEELYLEEVMDELRRFWSAQLEEAGVDTDDRLLRLHLGWDCALNGAGIINAAIRDLLTVH